MAHALSDSPRLEVSSLKAGRAEMTAVLSAVLFSGLLINDPAAARSHCMTTKAA